MRIENNFYGRRGDSSRHVTQDKCSVTSDRTDGNLLHVVTGVAMLIRRVSTIFLSDIELLLLEKRVW